MWNKRKMDKTNGRLCGALYGKCRKCDHRCNAKQCAALWMGRQVLYEWRGSCDRSTSQSRYFSLTVNTHTRDQPIKTIPLPKPRNGRDEHKNGSYAEHELDLRVCVMRPSVRDALYKRFFLWMKAVICKWEWLRKKGILSFLMSTSPRSVSNVFS